MESSSTCRHYKTTKFEYVNPHKGFRSVENVCLLCGETVSEFTSALPRKQPEADLAGERRVESGTGHPFCGISV